MVFDYQVKHNGKWYGVGEDVPIPTNTISAVKEETITNEKEPTISYKRADIQKMKLDDLKALAGKLGIDSDESANQLKKAIFIKLGM